MLAEAPDGPLHGVPVAIKDQFALPWRAPRDGAYANPFGVGPGESGIFRRLRDAGAVIVGVTNMHEFGLGTTGHISAYGPVRQPVGPVALRRRIFRRLGLRRLGAPGGGSGRHRRRRLDPDSRPRYCGATGLKFTWGQIPVDGFTHGHLTYGTAGPICRDAADARLLGEVLLSRPARGRRPRVACASASRGRSSGTTSTPRSSERARTRSTCCAAPASRHGRSRSPAWSTRRSPPPCRSGWSRFHPASPSWWPRSRRTCRCWCARCSKYQLLTPAPAIFKIERVRTQIRRSVAEAFEQVDVLAWPSTAAPAPPIENPTVSLPSGDYPADYANVRSRRHREHRRRARRLDPLRPQLIGPSDRPSAAGAVGR